MSSIYLFFDKVKIADSGCWLWTACVNKNGYGVFSLDATAKLAHRVSYAWEYGELSPVLDHLCRVRNCVNPKHLEAVTLQENSARGFPGNIMHNKTHCPQGHIFSEENIYMTGKYKHCRICDKLRHRVAYKRGY